MLRIKGNKDGYTTAFHKYNAVTLIKKLLFDHPFQSCSLPRAKFKLFFKPKAKESSWNLSKKGSEKSQKTHCLKNRPLEFPEGSPIQVVSRPNVA
jgi:hypothetical protein